jgi:hypothetical protein
VVFHVDHTRSLAHIRVRVFSAPDADQTFALLGELTMNRPDWQAFRALLIHQGGGDVRPDGSIRVVATPEEDPDV